MAHPKSPSRSGTPATRRRSSSYPAKKNRRPRPRSAKKLIGGVTLMPRTSGPRMIPKTSSSTTVGITTERNRTATVIVPARADAATIAKNGSGEIVTAL
jgi:hypothetical protein